MKRIRKTKSVQLILDAFKQDKAISIIELVIRFKNNMNKTTVYRILDRLEKSEILHSLKIKMDSKDMQRIIQILKKLKI